MAPEDEKTPETSDESLEQEALEPVIPTPVEEENASNPFRFVWIFLIVIFSLIIVFYLILLFSLFGGYVSNPLFEILGIGPEDLKNVLQSFTAGLFGFLSLILLFFALGHVFRTFTLPKGSPEKKKARKKAIIFSSTFLFVFGLFIALYILIASANTEAQVQQDNSLIVTEPANVLGLQAPITVSFDLEPRLKQRFGGDLSSVRQVSWDFDGDGVVDANGYQVAHRFLTKGENNGIFDVTAKVEFENAQGEREIFPTAREVVIENVGVYAEITTNTEQGVSPLSVEFSAAESSDPDGSIILYEWDFDDDGEYEKQQTSPEIIEYDFSQIGEHIVRLRVTGSQNDFATAEKTITVEGGRPSIEAKISSEVGFEGQAPFVVVLSGKNSYVRDGVITKYEWFIEGEKESVLGSQIRRVFREDGEFKVTLTVENDLGERHRSTETIIVQNKLGNQGAIITTDPPTEDEEDILEGDVPFAVEFDATNSEVEGAVDWQWDFDDDGLTDEFGQQVKKVYREPGRYVAHLTITTSDGREYKAIKRINVDVAGLRAKVTANQLSGSVPLSVEFDGSGSSADQGQIIDYIWEFPGEDPIHYGAQISYLFRNIGTFPVKMTVVDTLGRETTTMTYVSVRPPALIADFTATPETGYAPLEVQFDASPSQGVAVEYHWDFGDGTKAQTFKPIHLFQEPGTYIVQLKMVNDRGIVSRAEKRITIKSR